MESGTSGAQSLRTDVSAELAAALSAVTEASSENGRRYKPRVARLLCQTIAARAYGRPLLELAHLVAAAEEISPRDGYIGFFWRVPVASAAAYRAKAFDAASRLTADAGLRIDAGELVLGLEESEYRVSYGRIPFLAALLDFCITALGFPEIDGEIQAFLGKVRGRSAAQELANALSRRLYDFLKQHLPTQQYERKFNEMCAFLSNLHGRPAGSDTVDDRSALSFWEERVSRSAPVGDFRGFRTVAVAFLRLRSALKETETRRAVQSAVSIGTSREWGEVDPEEVGGALETMEHRRAILEGLAEPPANRLKAINKREAARLETVFEGGEESAAMPLTVMRADVFGVQQARITQALRQKREGMETVIAEGPEITYEEAFASYSGLLEHLVRVRLALMYMLLHHRRTSALEICLSLFPGVDISLNRPLVGVGAEVNAENVVPLHPERMISALFDLATGEGGDDTGLTDAFRSGRQAFSQVNRQGFSAADLRNEDMCDAAEAVEPLVRAGNRVLQGLVEALGQRFHILSADALFQEDRARFRRAFETLYREDA